eukprot:497852_1
MSLTQAIRFHHLITQLTSTECNQFLSTMAHSHSNVILSAFFQYVLQSNKTHEVARFNESLSNIIRSREGKPKQLAPKDMKLHEFPRPVIGYVGSFLYQHDYIDFSMTNRSIYLGCNSPNVLQELSLRKVKDYSDVCFASFPSVKTLFIDPSKVIHS